MDIFDEPQGVGAVLEMDINTNSTRNLYNKPQSSLPREWANKRIFTNEPDGCFLLEVLLTNRVGQIDAEICKFR
ncbi:hypothetical protein [Paraburkholderia flagellata]|uniref:hypothetical protein n=1 Tax=Paraburkholderia flagellata TaxID=2883241 RepID=UPI001F402C24|nr:hypothetical protein [Paraburkholderia flagellata]